MKGKIVGITQKPVCFDEEIEFNLSVDIVGKEAQKLTNYFYITRDKDVEIQSWTEYQFGEKLDKIANAFNEVFNKRDMCKVIFNEPATILYKDGKKYVCKCDKEDTFNEELGLALCLLKSFGVSYSDFRELLDNAKRQGGKNE
jgi:hypothetical protein